MRVVLIMVGVHNYVETSVVKICALASMATYWRVMDKVAMVNTINSVIF